MVKSMNQSMDYVKSPLWDSTLPVEKRIAYLLANMTLEEKFDFLATTTPALSRLGITEFSIGGEAAHGIEARNDQNNRGGAEPTTSFTQPIGMSASWDTELIEEIGKIVGTEARVIYNRRPDGGLSRWAPTVDMERDPRWGRTEEAYGEDPCLTGKMASAYINGLQGRHKEYLRMAATLKHFYANNVEEGRTHKSSSIDPRNKYEYYLEPFRLCITEGRAEAMMTAYNEINGMPAILNHEVDELVKKRWKMRGHVVCDGGAMLQTVDCHHYFGTHAETVVEGLKAGIDCFTDDPKEVAKAVKEAFELGYIEESDIDRALANSFGTKIRLGIYDKEKRNPYANVDENDINTEEAARLSCRMAEESCILLKNEDDFLPLQKTDDVVLVGPLGNVWYKDWYGGEPPYRKTLKSGIEQVLGRRIKFVSGLPGIYLRCGDNYVGLDSQYRLILVKEKGQAEEFIWQDWGFGSSTLLSMSNGKYISVYEEKNCLRADKEEAFGWYVKESFDFKQQLDGSFQLYTWNDKPLGVRKNGCLAIQAEGRTSFSVEIITDGMKLALEYAANANKVIVALGCNPMINSKEEVDRSDIILPPNQENLVKEIARVNPNIVMLLMTNYPYAINWQEQNIPAILQFATGSQEMGYAVARILFGENNPAGRLPMTWYHTINDLPDMDDYDIIKKNRTYQYFGEEVLYPFGFGLSYTTFEYHDAKIKLIDQTELQVQIEVTNTGRVEGDEVVQLYSKGPDTSRIKHPQKRLIGFHKERGIQPGDTRCVIIRAAIESLQVYDVISKKRIVEAGQYSFYIGRNSGDEEMTMSLPITGETTGQRAAADITFADHYDDYENVFLAQAQGMYTCVAIKKKEEGASLIYRDFDLSHNVRNMVLHFDCMNQGGLSVLINGETVASWQGSGYNLFTNMKLALTRSRFEKGSKVELKLEGDVRVSRFWFEE